MGQGGGGAVIVRSCPLQCVTRSRISSLAEDCSLGHGRDEAQLMKEVTAR